MFSESIYFYIFSILLICNCAAVIFAPRMVLALFGLFLSFLFTGLICWTLNAHFIAIFQFVLCGLILCPVIFLLMNKISRWSLPLKLVRPFKIIIAALVSLGFGALVCLFIKEEFASSLLNIFNFVNEKSSDSVHFFSYAFPLHLLLILVVVTVIVISAIVFPSQEDEEVRND